MKSIGLIVVNMGELFQAFAVVYFLIRIFGFRENVKAKKFKIGYCGIILFVVARICTMFGVNNLIFTVIWLVIMIVYSNIFLKNTKIQHLLWSIYALLLIPLINVGLSLGVSTIFDIEISNFLNVENKIYLVTAVIAKIMYLGMIELTICIYKMRVRRISKKYGITMAILLGYSIVIEAILAYQFRLYDVRKYKWGLLSVALGVILLDIYLFVTIFKMSEKYEQEEAVKLLKIQNELQERRILEAETETRRIRQIRHDYKSLISNINVMLEKEEYEKIQEYLEEITGYYLKSIPEYICTNNSLLDAAINTKFAYCNENGIETSCKIIGECNGIDDFKLALIVLNLLDNAIEASEREIEKEVDLQMKRDEEYIHLIVRNRIRNSVLEKNPELKSSKEEKGHGLGLEHVKNILEENKGLWEVYEEKGWFCVHVMSLSKNN